MRSTPLKQHLSESHFVFIGVCLQFRGNLRTTYRRSIREVGWIFGGEGRGRGTKGIAGLLAIFRHSLSGTTGHGIHHGHPLAILSVFAVVEKFGIVGTW